MATKPNPLDELARAKVTKGTKDEIERAAAERGLTPSDVIRQAIDQHLAKAGGPALDPVVTRVVAEVERQVADAVAEATRGRDERVAEALVLVAGRLDRIEAAQGRRAA